MSFKYIRGWETIPLLRSWSSAPPLSLGKISWAETSISRASVCCPLAVCPIYCLLLGSCKMPPWSFLPGFPPVGCLCVLVSSGLDMHSWHTLTSAEKGLKLEWKLLWIHKGTDNNTGFPSPRALGSLLFEGSVLLPQPFFIHANEGSSMMSKPTALAVSLDFAGSRKQLMASSIISRITVSSPHLWHQRILCFL